MKKFLIVIALFALSLFFTPLSINASAGNTFNLTIANVTPSTGQTGTEFTVQIHTWLYQCTAIDPITSKHYLVPDPSICSYYSPATSDGPVGSSSIDRIRLVVSGSGNTILTSPLATGNDGNASFRFTSSVAGQKTISFAQYDGALVMGGNWGTKSITIANPPATTPTNNPNSSSSSSRSALTSTPATAATTTQAPPAVPVLESLKVGNTQFAANTVADHQFNESDPKVFSGTTIPNGLVHLYFHSDPFEDTAIADANGVWTYELKKDLGAGEHTLQIAVTDPKTKLTSGKTAEQKFILIAGETTTKTQPATPTEAKPIVLWYVLVGVLVLLTAGSMGVFIFWKKKLRLR